MKRIIFPMLLLAMALISCSKRDSGNEQAINVADLPKSVVSYIENNYPAESIYNADKVTDSDVRYVVTLTTDEKLEFDRNGGFMGEDIAFSRHGRHHHHGRGHDHNGIPSDSLSSVILSYISTNFAGYSVMHAETDSICSNGIVTEVMIFKSESAPEKLYFTVTGTFLMQGTRVLSSVLPQAVKEAITAQFSGFTLTERSEKYILADNYTVEYILFLYKADVHKRAIIKEDGTVVCEQ